MRNGPFVAAGVPVAEPRGGPPPRGHMYKRGESSLQKLCSSIEHHTVSDAPSLLCCSTAGSRGSRGRPD
jgi:hypothetical protein